MASSMLWLAVLFATVALSLTAVPPRPPWCFNPNEQWSTCTCDSTCTKNATCGFCKPDSPGSCSCTPGNVRNDKGVCIAQKDCPPKCGKYEKWYPCGACDSPCHNDRKCDKKCGKGSCGCIKGYKRTKDKKCIPADKCPKKPKCDKNEKFYPCGPCDGTCKDPARKCPKECKYAGGCGCEKNYVRDSKKKCVKKDKCSAGKAGKGGTDKKGGKGG